MGRNPKRTLVRALILMVASGVIFGFVLLPIRIRGDSMLPAYHDGGINFVNRLAYSFGQPKRGDVVAIKTSGIHIMYLKRIIGLPGETFAILKGVVLINGQPLDEPYVKNRKGWELSPQKLLAGHYLVIGDNRGMDQQLHEFGVIRAAKIVGKVLW